MARAFAEIAFTPTIQAMQKVDGSDEWYGPLLEPEAEAGDQLTEREASFIAERDGFYQATVSETGWPYVQFRGGEVGFLKVIDSRTIAFADFRGNRQFVSVGNLTNNDRVALFLMDYPNRRRLKLWGRVKIVDAKDDPNLVKELHVPGYRAKAERAFVVTVEAFDWNCPQHIPQRLTLAELDEHLGPVRQEVELLKAENQHLKELLEKHAAEPHQATSKHEELLATD